MIASVPGERITFIVSVPAIYSLTLRRPEFATTDVSAVRWVGYGGSPITPTLVQALQDAFPAARVFNGYGMTETASIMSVLPHDDAIEHADSVGYSVRSVDLGIVPLDDDPVTGELVVRGANVTAGYWQRPETNAETIVDGWLHTGDIVRVDDAGRVPAGYRPLCPDLAQQWTSRKGIRVNAIAPGHFESEMSGQFDERAHAAVVARAAAGRLGEPGELSGALIFLASPASSYVTGIVLLVDGGTLLT